MALVFSTPTINYVGNQVEATGTVAFDSSYPANGEAVTIGDLGLTSLTDLEVDPSAGYVFEWDGSTTSPKVLAYWVDTTVDGAPLAEVTAATDLSGVTAARYTARGF